MRSRLGKWLSLPFTATKLVVQCLSVLVLLAPVIVQSKPVRIEVTGGSEAALPIAIVSFQWTGKTAGPKVDVAAVVTEDLARSGFFAPIPQSDFLSRPVFGGDVRFKTWRTLGADNLVLGRIEPNGEQGYVIEFELFDVYKGERIAGFRIPTQESQLRNAGHYVADLIYEKLTGRKGAFNTKIVYVAVKHEEKGKVYQLIVSDADGHFPQAILTSKEPLMSPSWSPDGKKVAYVSFEKKQTQIYVQDVASGQREQIVAYPGINGAPSWSPDQRQLAFVLSKDGNPEIYLYQFAGKEILRLTFSPGIDTEPVWAADGKTIYFTSDRGGRPQIYSASSRGGRAERVTFEGSYNARPTVSFDGRYMAMVHGREGRYYIALMDLHGKDFRILSDGALDESPSFAPNGDMVIYATENGARSQLRSIARNGLGKQQVLIEGDVREPAWSPFSQK